MLACLCTALNGGPVQVDDALSFCSRLHDWSTALCSYFVSTVFPIEPKHGLDLSALNADAIFVPVLPLFESSASTRDLNGAWRHWRL